MSKDLDNKYYKVRQEIFDAYDRGDIPSKTYEGIIDKLYTLGLALEGSEKSMSEQIDENSSIYDSGFDDGYNQGQDDLRNSIEKENFCDYYQDPVDNTYYNSECGRNDIDICDIQTWQYCPYCGKRIEIKED